jgi:hypothetical protein
MERFSEPAQTRKLFHASTALACGDGQALYDAYDAQPNFRGTGLAEFAADKRQVSID